MIGPEQPTVAQNRNRGVRRRGHRIVLGQSGGRRHQTVQLSNAESRHGHVEAESLELAQLHAQYSRIPRRFLVRPVIHEPVAADLFGSQVARHMHHPRAHPFLCHPYAVGRERVRVERHDGALRALAPIHRYFHLDAAE